MTPAVTGIAFAVWAKDWKGDLESILASFVSFLAHVDKFDLLDFRVRLIEYDAAVVGVAPRLSNPVGDLLASADMVRVRPSILPVAPSAFAQGAVQHVRHESDRPLVFARYVCIDACTLRGVTGGFDHLLSSDAAALLLL